MGRSPGSQVGSTRNRRGLKARDSLPKVTHRRLNTNHRRLNASRCSGDSVKKLNNSSRPLNHRLSLRRTSAEEGKRRREGRGEERPPSPRLLPLSLALFEHEHVLVSDHLLWATSEACPTDLGELEERRTGHQDSPADPGEQGHVSLHEFEATRRCRFYQGPGQVDESAVASPGLMGATGSGKSTLLTHLILDDVAAGRGAVVVDPKGDLVADVSARLTPAQRSRVVVLDPQVPEGRPTLNMLEVPEGVGNDLVVDHLVGIFGRIFERHWGPRLEDVLRSTCLTLLQRGGATLSDVPRLLADPGAHSKFLTAGSDEELRGFWKWYEALGDAQRAQVVGPLLYKLRAFLLRPFVREIVDAPVSSIDMARILDGGLLLVRVPKGILGEDTARLLGSFVVAKVWQAATARAAVGQEARVDASLYVDECQNFLTLPRSFDEILAEARGYRLSLVLAHQHLGQLPRELRDAVSANARNKVFFTMSPEDAFVLARHTNPTLTDHDLANLDAYQAAARLVVGGQDQPAFTLRTRPVPQPVAAP